MLADQPLSQPDKFKKGKNKSPTPGQIAALEESHFFSPGFVNSARLDFSRSAVINYETFEAINPAANDLSLGMMLGRNSPSIRISGGFANMPAGFPGGFSHHNWNSYQFYDDAFLTRGTHSLKFGFAGENMRYNFLQFYNPQGIVRFTSLANFLTNRLNSLE